MRLPHPPCQAPGQNSPRFPPFSAPAEFRPVAGLSAGLDADIISREDRPMNWDAILERLRADRENWTAVAAAVDRTPHQIRRIASGKTRWPRLDTVQRLTEYYRRRRASQ